MKELVNSDRIGLAHVIKERKEAKSFLLLTDYSNFFLERNLYRVILLPVLDNLIFNFFHTVLVWRTQPCSAAEEAIKTCVV